MAFPAVATAHEPGGAPANAGIADPRSAATQLHYAPMAATRDYPWALWEPASTRNYTFADRQNDVAITRLVIHVAEGGFASTYQWFKNPGVGASAHYVVSSTGQVAQMVPEHDIAWHAGNWLYNETSVGIEHAGYTYGAPFPSAEYRGSARLAGYLARKYAITPDRSHVIGHNQVPDPNHPGEYGGVSHHTDPGPHWNWPLYMAYLRLAAATTPALTVDNSSPNFTAGWRWRTVSGGGAIGGSSRATIPGTIGEAAAYATALPHDGLYDAFLRWPCLAGRNPATRVVVHTATGSATRVVNETARCAVWVWLGAYDFEAARALRVQVLRSSAARGTVMTDAVRFVAQADTIAPTRPPVSLSAVTSAGATLSWGTATDDVGIWGYQVFLDGVRIDLGQALSTAVIGLPCATAHTLVVRSIDRSGHRSLPVTVPLTTDPCPPPPANLVQTGQATDGFTVGWDPVPGAVRYRVWGPRVTLRTTTLTSATVSGLLCGGSRLVNVAAQDAAGSISAPAQITAYAAAC